MAAKLCRTPIFEALSEQDSSSTAIVNHVSGASFSYGSLLRDIAQTKYRLLEDIGENSDIAGKRIAFLVENGYGYVVALLSILASGAIAVPLAPTFPPPELRYILNDNGAAMLLSSATYAKLAEEVLQEGLVRVPVLHSLEAFDKPNDKGFEIEWIEFPQELTSGMLLYTSGTTARPKGVLLLEANLVAQAHSLHTAWGYRPCDHLLHILPLHHIHGIVNALLAPLLAGSSVEFMSPFNAGRVWERLAAPFLPTDLADRATNDNGVTPIMEIISFLTAVPTVWSRMLASYSLLSPELQKAGKEAISQKNLRLNISGSAALPSPIRDAWKELSGGNVLLERYGMTEVGMAISCGLDYGDRVESSVGWPLPSVQVRLAERNDKTGEEVTIPVGEEIDPVTGKERYGEIQLRGPTTFKGYWRNPAATEKEFTLDGWFKTGDIAIRRVVPGAGDGKSGSWARGPAYFIQGRRSADIIKSGGEKVSALEVERELLSLPNVAECAVVGLPSESWGQKVAAIVVSKSDPNIGEPWGLKEMRRDLKGRIVPYKIPQDLQIVQSIQRNAMGKVNKKDLVRDVFGDEERIRRRSLTGRQEQGYC
ncbi:AMP-binding enzyme [Paramyrothecium foliicola]|nr:AMP-binding enzyme [Paramyrothecium foliicola]